MTAVHAFVCDATVDSPVPLKPGAAFAARMHGLTSAHPCPAMSRPARSPMMLRIITERDGWTTTLDNQHLCPAHTVVTSAVPA